MEPTFIIYHCSKKKQQEKKKKEYVHSLKSLKG